MSLLMLKCPHAHIHCLVIHGCPTFCDPWTAAPQVPLSMELCGQGYWSGYLLPPPGGLPTQGLSLVSPALADGFLPPHHLGSPMKSFTC